MFCSEPIQKVYYGQHISDSYGDAAFDFFYDMAMHLSGRNRFLMETAHFYISVEVSGVFLIIKEGGVESIQRENEWIDSCIHEDTNPEFAPWVDYEATVFPGERLLSVEKEEAHYTLRFDDFTMKLVPHPVSNDDFFVYPHPYSRLLGAERLIHKCKCGGTGIPVIDLVGDYSIRCDRCHLGTSAGMCVCDAIDEWNAGVGLHTLGLYPEEIFMEHCHEKIKELRIKKNDSQNDSNVIKCREFLAVYDNHVFHIESWYAGNGTWGFAFTASTRFNAQQWPFVISATEEQAITYIRHNKEKNRNAEMVFTIGEKQAILVANHGWLEFEV